MHSLPRPQLLSLASALPAPEAQCKILTTRLTHRIPASAPSCPEAPLAMPSPLTPFLSGLSSSVTLRALPQPLFVGMWVCQGVATASRTPWMGRRTPPPFTDGMPEVQGAAPYQGPRGKAGPERPRAPLAWAPSPAPLLPWPPPPPSCWGLIQACGK